MISHQPLLPILELARSVNEYSFLCGIIVSTGVSQDENTNAKSKAPFRKKFIHLFLSRMLTEEALSSPTDEIVIFGVSYATSIEHWNSIINAEMVRLGRLPLAGCALSHGDELVW